MRYRQIPLTVVRLVSLVLALVATGLAGLSAGAQDATPVASASSLGLPELKVTASDTGYQLDQTELAAGRYLVTLEYTGENVSDSPGADIMQLPDGLTAADLAPPAPAAGETPAAATAPAGDEEGGAPTRFYETKMAGGPLSGSISRFAQSIVDLTPGNWVVWAGDPTATLTPVALTITGEANATPAAAAEPTSDLTVTEKEYAFDIPDGVTAGPQVWKVTNDGEQPHFLAVGQVPEGTTLEQLQTLLSLPENGTPPPGVPDPNTFKGYGGIGTLSAGQTGWAILDLRPGTYFAICFISDQETGVPHAMMGMVQLFTVSG